MDRCDSEEELICWKYEPQTKKKHEIIKKYLEKWIDILGKYSGLNYFDCFGGCGQYVDENGKIFYGSPIIASQIIQEKINKGKNVAVVIIDKSEKNIENIKRILKRINIKIKDIMYIHDDFDNAINNLLDKYSNLAPSFFFIDPFGFKIKLKTIKRIMERKKSEVVLNFMFNFVNRFMELNQNKENMNELFGGEEWQEICEKFGEEREKSMIDLYKRKLEGFVKFVSIFPFRFKDKDRTFYYLIHLTNHLKGCEIMRACAKGGYKGKFEFQKRLFDFKSFKIKEIEKFILENFKENVKYRDLNENILKTKNYQVSEILSALKNLELKDEIKIERDPPETATGKKRESIYNDDTIIFK